MEEHRIRRLPVIESHRLVGMISEADLARHLPDRQVRATFPVTSRAWRMIASRRAAFRSSSRSFVRSFARVS